MSGFSQVTVNKQFNLTHISVMTTFYEEWKDLNWNTSFFKSFDKIPNETVVAMENISSLK